MAGEPFFSLSASEDAVSPNQSRCGFSVSSCLYG